MKTFIFILSFTLSSFAFGQNRKMYTNSGILIETTQYVDLGLPSGNLWASCNIGANKPEEKGSYFAWGEVVAKSIFFWDNYFDTKGYEFSRNRYFESNVQGKDDFNMFFPNGGKTKIAGDLCYDVATLKLGAPWHIPSKADFDELYDESSMIPDIYHGVFGFAVIGPNRKAIFIPAAGGIIGSDPVNKPNAGRYWLADLHSYYPDSAYYFGFNADSKNLVKDHTYRCIGYSIRPVATL